MTDASVNSNFARGVTGVEDILCVGKLINFHIFCSFSVKVKITMYVYYILFFLKIMA